MQDCIKQKKGESKMKKPTKEEIIEKVIVYGPLYLTNKA